MQKHAFRTEGRTPGEAPPIDRPLIEIAAKMGELPAEKFPALVAKMTALVKWHAAESDDVPATDLHSEMQACADALFEAEMRKDLLSLPARHLLRETYQELLPSGDAPKPRDAKAILFTRRSAGRPSDVSAAVTADLRAVSRLTRMADIAACESKPKGGRPLLLGGIAYDVLAAWSAVTGRPVMFGRRKDLINYPKPDFCACRLLLQALLPDAPVAEVTRALWQAFDRRPRAGTETKAAVAEGFPAPAVVPKRSELNLVCPSDFHGIANIPADANLIGG
jgi:hypothetical protein